METGESPKPELTALEEQTLESAFQKAQKLKKPVIEILERERTRSLKNHSKMKVTRTQTQEEIDNSRNFYQTIFTHLIEHVSEGKKE